MLNLTRLLIITAIVSLSGCVTTFKGPEVIYSRGQPCIIYTRQGSIPESAIYRDVWPISPVVAVTNQPKSKFLAIPVIGSIISTVASVASTIMGNGGSDKNYRYRDDLVIIGATNLTPENISSILEKINAPHTDAQRSGWLPAGSGSGVESSVKGE